MSNATMNTAVPADHVQKGLFVSTPKTMKKGIIIHASGIAVIMMDIMHARIAMGIIANSVQM